MNYSQIEVLTAKGAVIRAFGTDRRQEAIAFAREHHQNGAFPNCVVTVAEYPDPAPVRRTIWREAYLRLVG